MIETALCNNRANGRKTGTAVCYYLKGMFFSQLAAPQQRVPALTLANNLIFLLMHFPRAAHKAEAFFQEAISIGNDVGAYNFVAQSHLELGRLLKAKKKPDRAKEHLLEAKRIFSDFDNEFYLSQAEKFLAELDRREVTAR